MNSGDTLILDPPFGESTQAVEIKETLARRWIAERMAGVADLVHRYLHAQDGVDIRCPELAIFRVHAVGLASRFNKAAGCFEPCVRCYVLWAGDEKRLPAEAWIPRNIDGVPIETMECPPAQAGSCSDQRQALQSPVLGGISVGNRDCRTTGTLTGVVRRKGDPKQDPHWLCAQHVFAFGSDTAGSPVWAPPGSSIIQPGWAHATQGTRSIGVLEDYTSYKLQLVPPGAALPGSSLFNSADAALARCTLGPNQWSPDVCKFGAIRSATTVQDMYGAMKHGASSGFTLGVVDSTRTDIAVDYPAHGVGFFENQVLVRGVEFPASFSSPGDSGALVAVFEGGQVKAVGMVIGKVKLDVTKPQTWAKAGYTVVTPIETVYRKLGVEAWT